jgi:hypothetical protein
MKKREKKATTKLIHYLKSDKCPIHTGALEVKVFRNNKPIPLSEIYEHQKRNLSIVAHEKFVYKIIDCGYQNPFDIIMLEKELAYLVVINPKTLIAYFIHIDDLMVWISKKIRKSLSLEIVQDLAIFSEKLI